MKTSRIYTQAQLEYIDELNNAVTTLKQSYSTAAQSLYEYKCRPENNVFDYLDEASSELEKELIGEATEACEGAGNCGMDTYEQGFFVDGTAYIARLDVEYNRHDRTYYYVDGRKFSVTPK